SVGVRTTEGGLYNTAGNWLERCKLGGVVEFFFFQAEDGIRDRTVTGVQTCALPISRSRQHPTDVGRRGVPLGREPQSGHDPRRPPRGRFLCHPDTASAFSPRHPAGGEGSRHGLDDTGGVDRGLSALQLAWHAPRRGTPFHAEAV